MRYELKNQHKMKYCNNCLYPELAVNLILDDDGVCGACRLQEQMNSLGPEQWEARERVFSRIIAKTKAETTADYDCVIPVSGGKDSYFQTHLALEYGLRPLLVTYHGNNYLPEGQRNLEKMRDVFGVDHLVFGPSVSNLKRLNVQGFLQVGDMNWHAHAGIKIMPMQIAVRFKIPLVIWGEITWSVSGMFELDDYVTYNKRTVFEHDLRGKTVEEMCSPDPQLDARDLPWLKMPSDHEFEESGTVGIYIGNFFDWDPNRHSDYVTKTYGFEQAAEPFERTYRRMSNLDDMHENGVHDYMKFIKFGYGRATDHASKDIRTGDLDRQTGLEYVRQMDHVLPRKDFERWLDYVGMQEEEFHKIADSFRDPRVWWLEDGSWWKMNPWGEPSCYGVSDLD